MNTGSPSQPDVLVPPPPPPLLSPQTPMAQPVLCLQLAVIAAPSLKSRSMGVFHDAPEGCPSNVLILGTAEGCLGGCNRHCITAAGATGSTLLLSWPNRQSQVPRAAAFRLILGERFCQLHQGTPTPSLTPNTAGLSPFPALVPVVQSGSHKGLMNRAWSMTSVHRTMGRLRLLRSVQTATVDAQAATKATRVMCTHRATASLP